MDTRTARAAHSGAGAVAYGQRRASSGQALLILIGMLSIATMLLVYGATTEAGRAVRADTRTRSVIDEARQALVGRAIADANRPGSFPCPDGDDDGSADLFVGSACSSYIGRLPWRSLGIGDLRDDAGERLWYALSPAFRDHPSAPPLNADTPGSLTLYSNSTARVVTTHGIAAVFAPGVALGSQRRDSGVALCVTTSRNVPRNRCPTNYLDVSGASSNASAAGPYIAAAPANLYNDKVTMIVAADVMPLVERRVVMEVRNALLEYRSRAACGCYPWPDGTADGASDIGISRGRIPTQNTLPQSWPPGVLPAYFVRNEWSRGIHYAVARQALEGGGKACTTCNERNLTLDGTRGYDVVLIASGYAEKERSSVAWSDYLDDPENRDGDDRYTTPLSLAPDRNRVFAIAGLAAGCAASARVLIDHLPCARADKALRPACESASTALNGCRCAADARVLMRPPCATHLGAKPCELAVTQLRGCTS